MFYLMEGRWSGGSEAQLIRYFVSNKMFIGVHRDTPLQSSKIPQP
jgi:hypothetical protein